MNYFTLIEDIKRTSLQFAEEFYEGDVYEFLNSGNHKYPSIILTTQNVSTTDNINSISGTLFCVDRLTDDSSNRLEIQSNAFNKLQRIISALEENTINLQSNTYTPFTEKFADLCGGMFVEFSFQYVGESLCDDLEIKEIELTQNGIYDVIGYDRAIVNVRPVVNLEDITITDNGEYTPSEGFDGFSKVNVDLKGKVKPNTIKYNSVGSETIEFNLVDYSLIKDCSYFIYQCPNLKKVILKGANFKSATTFNRAIYNCDNLELLDLENAFTENVTDFYYAFGNNDKIVTLNLVGVSAKSATNIKNIFTYNIVMETLVGSYTIDEVINNNLKILDELKISISVYPSAKLNRASLRAVINGLADLSDTTTQTLTLGATLKAKLTEEDIAIATAKNWTIA